VNDNVINVINVHFIYIIYTANESIILIVYFLHMRARVYTYTHR